ncbi:MAG: hypothetical protein ACRCX5_05320 [Bacteroidales bacterium]
MAKFVLVKDQIGEDVYLNLESLVEFRVDGDGTIYTYINRVMEEYYTESPETIYKIKNYIKENML